MTAPPGKRQKNDGACSVAGCGQPSRKRGWCASHYAQWYRCGEVRPFAYKWNERADNCLVCQKPTGDSRFRRFCSGACDFLYRKYGGNVPTVAACVGCGCDIDLTARGKGGQRKKAHVSFCRRCKAEYGKYKLTTAQLAQRDGTDCGICLEPVDMGLRRGDPGVLMCASVDHILPRSLGGTHEPENLQLAHLACNMAKSDRVAGVAPDPRRAGGRNE